MATRTTWAEAQQRTREELLAGAEVLFLERGYHATSLEQIARAAGYTKGAVYANFASKDDLFLALYERRVEAGLAQARRAFAEDGAAGGLERLALERGDEQRDERWLAVFLEFWAHVIRNAGARDRFAALHARALEPFVEATERLVSDHGADLPCDAPSWTLAMNAMHLGVVLERLTQPGVVAPDLGTRLQRFMTERVLG